MDSPTTPRDGHGHFRESDMEFLTAQATEWLEAVLAEELDDQTSLEDLLADGSVLYKVAQHIREDSNFPGHAESPRSASSSPAMERRSSLKYQPYASVEAFLKVCKEVGLQDLDVFNASDAVDKKDIRRVCVCLRRLSKKGRKLGIRVPDFDNVRDTLVTPSSKMPRDAVRRTQESLTRSSSRGSRTAGANGQVSSETSSLIGELRRDDAGPIEDDSKPRKPKPLVSIRSGVDSTHGPASRASHLHSPSHEYDADRDANTEDLATRKPSEGPVDEKSKSEERRKGLFKAHLQGTEPYPTKKEQSKKEDEKDGGFSLLCVLGGVLVIAGGVAGVLVWKKRSEGDGDADDENLYEVRRGDNLTKIARGSGKKNWHEIADKNPSLHNPHLIYPGDRLEL